CPECFNGNGADYRGSASFSNDGTVCQMWNQQSPHAHSDTSPDTYPELVENYCRNPGGLMKQPYCYRNSNNDPDKMYCDIPRCGKCDCFNGRGVLYNGTINTVISLSPCENWRGVYKAMIEAAGLSTHNYCRNPNPSVRAGPWCYARGDQTWQYCSVPRCPTKEGEIFAIPPCNTQDCLSCLQGNGRLYRGDVKQSANGNACLPWSTHQSSQSLFPQSEYPELQENFCRNPGGQTVLPWCYTNTNMWKSYCELPHCSDDSLHTIPYTIPIENVDCFIGEGLGYTGEVSVTLSGRNCQQWSVKSPHTHRYIVSGSGIELNGAICRNPSPYGKRKGPWCFVDDIEVRWEYCNIPRC
uniref:Kringle domain-containing protein n=1 Tax=Ciona savignyi TaxID=51511 RepID=H2YUH2_CIOSA